MTRKPEAPHISSVVGGGGGGERERERERGGERLNHMIVHAAMLWLSA